MCLMRLDMPKTKNVTALSRFMQKINRYMPPNGNADLFIRPLILTIFVQNAHAQRETMA